MERYTLAIHPGIIQPIVVYHTLLVMSKQSNADNAADLCLGERLRETQPIEQTRGGNTIVGKEGVFEERNEKRDSLRLILATQRTRKEVSVSRRCSASFQTACCTLCGE